MQWIASLLLLCALFGITLGKPIGRIRGKQRLVAPAVLPPQQQYLSDHTLQHSEATHQHKLTHGHLDAAPNSVGVLFTNAGSSEDEELVVHAWLPLGRRVFTRDSPDLPLHPTSARITTMIRSTPQIAMREHLDRVVCEIFPRYNRTMDNQNPEALAIRISRADELVRLAGVSGKPWREIEAYECS